MASGLLLKKMTVSGYNLTKTERKGTLNKIDFIKKATLVMLVFLIFTMNSSMNYANVKHWFYPISLEMIQLEIINPNEQFYQGSGFTELEMIQLLKRILPTKKFVVGDDNSTSLTRSEMITQLVGHLELEKFIAKFPQSTSPFIDVRSNQANINFALQFDFISMNTTRTFRPDAMIKKEEAYTIIYNVYKAYYSKLDTLHSYYAINSYPQLSFADHLDSLSFGWSRLELSADKSNVVLNMSRSNSNEYGVPTGYATAINATESMPLTRQLMVFVKEEYVYDANIQKNVTLAEALLSNPTWRDSVLNSIMDALLKNDYKIPFDGVVIDIEGLKGESNAQNLNVFIKMLSEKLKSNNLSLYVAVHPVGLNQTDYYDGYDYKTIGEYSDYVILMAHDYYSKRLTQTEMTAGYTVTPLTPINEIFYALANITNSKTGVQDSRKILFQFSMDAVQWKLQENKVIHSKPFNPLYGSILSRINEGAMKYYSANLQSPYITFDDHTDGTYNVVWYENAQSITAKLDMAKLFKLGGVSIWRLGTIPNYDSQDLQIWETILNHIK